MERQEFIRFCNKKFKKRGYKKHKNRFYLVETNEVMSCIELQKSNFSSAYYINCLFFLGDFRNVSYSDYPTRYDHDLYFRIIVMSVTETINGEPFETGAIEYEEYTEETLKPFFDKAFEELILPTVINGKKYILDNLCKFHISPLKRDEVLRILNYNLGDGSTPLKNSN